MEHKNKLNNLFQTVSNDDGPVYHALEIIQGSRNDISMSTSFQRPYPFGTYFRRWPTTDA